MRRILMAVCAAGLIVAVGAAPAFAWQNGETRDGFGTHDWILHHAMALAGEDAAWIDQNEALLSSDDPDSWRDDFEFTSAEYRTEQPLHLYYPDSTKQGGPQAVTDHYALMVRALSAEDTLTASRELGYLSHYYADMLAPFHTFSYGYGSLEEGTDHRYYETRVDLVTRSPNTHTEWVSSLAPRPMTDVRARAIEAAILSGNAMLGLIAEYGTFESYDPAGDLQTRMLLNRAVNDLADLIRSARTGAGQPRPIASIQTWADYYYPALGRPARIWAKVKDDQGRVVRGVKVDYEFQVTQPCSYTQYTDAEGITRNTHQNILGAVDVPVRVVVTATSAGTTLMSTVVLLPKTVIGEGSAGIRTYTKYDASPAQGTTVTVKTHVQDKYARPIKGLKVVFTWKHKSRWIKQTVTTNSSGNAWTSRNIGNAKAGYRVYVRADAYGGTEPKNKYDGIRTSTSSFVPNSGVGSLRTYRRSPAMPSQSTTVTVKAKCLDDHGKPIIGRTVKFGWKHKGSTRYTYARTNAYGNAYTTRNIGRSTADFKVYVTAYVKSGSTVKKSSVSFTPVTP